MNQRLTQLTPELEQQFRSIVGSKGFLSPQDDIEKYVVEERGLYRGAPLAVIRPAHVEEVSAVVKLAVEAGVSITPQGGNTGLCGGSVAGLKRAEILLSLDRMRVVREIDPANSTATFEAGVTLVEAQQAAERCHLLFPMSYGSEGTATVGGAISTNAGGMNVLRYGNTRDLVLGLEVVLADGSIVNGLRGLRKDNTGYDLKQLFIGSEGTLGIVTAAVMSLESRPENRVTAMLALEKMEKSIAVLQLLRDQIGESLLAYEFLSGNCIDLTLQHVLGATDPLGIERPWNVLIEIGVHNAEQGAADLERVLGDAFETGQIIDAVIAQSISQADKIWALREGVIEAQKREGASIKHDVALPISRVCEFLDRASGIVQSIAPNCRPTPFGHLGDGNIHYNVLQPTDWSAQAFLDKWEDMTGAVHDLVDDLGGSFSAEHGVGVLKTGDLEKYRQPIEVELMRKIKMTFDPQGILNPGKVIRFPDEYD